MRSRWAVSLAAVLVAGFLVRAIYVLAVTDASAIGDQVYYSVQAHLNATGHWFVQPFAEHQPGADHPPLTVAALTPITWVLRNGPFLAGQRWFTVLVGVGNLGLLAVVTRRLLGERIALIAVALAAIHAAFWMGDTLILSEPYAIAAILLLALATLRLAAAPSGRRAGLAGLAAGVVALGRPEMALLVPLVLLPVTLRGLRSGERAAALRRTAIALGTAALLVAPWVGWNLARFEDRVLISANDGFTLLGANCPETYFGPAIGSYAIGCALAPEIPAGWDSSQASALRSELAIDYARDHLTRLPVVAAARFARLWLVFDPVREVRGGPGEGRPQWAMWIGVVQFWVLVPLAVVGARAVDRPVRRLVLALPAVATFAGVLIAAYWRIRVPADLALVVLAAAGIDRLWSRRRPQAVIVAR